MHRMLASLLVACAVAHCAYGYLEIVDVEPQIEVVSSSVLIPPPRILPTPAPPYSSSARTALAAINFIKENTACPLTSTKQNYISLLFAFRAMAEGVSSGLCYESVYSTVNVIVLLGKLMPESARELLVTRYDNAISKILPVLNLIQDRCPKGCTDYNCDRKIHLTIERNPVYRASARLLLETGKVCESYIQIRNPTLKAAAEGRVVAYLTQNKYILKPLIEQDALVLNIARGL